MEDVYNLNRFITAQSSSYEFALSEIRSGNKQSHWMWYIFPQLKGLGRSYNSDFYGISCREEAAAYLKHEIMGRRLIEISEVLLQVEGKSARQIFGQTDALKLKSCMTLFDAVQNETDVFSKVLDKYYQGKKSVRTISVIK